MTLTRMRSIYPCCNLASARLALDLVASCASTGSNMMPSVPAPRCAKESVCHIMS